MTHIFLQYGKILQHASHARLNVVEHACPLAFIGEHKQLLHPYMRADLIHVLSAMQCCDLLLYTSRFTSAQLVSGTVLGVIFKVVGVSGAEVAEQLRYRVRNETQLTCSVGIGPNTLLAKVATDINKPNGQYVLPEDPTALKEFVQSLNLRKVPGIGKVCFICLSC